MSDEITICGKVTESGGEIVAVAVWRVEEFEPWPPRGSNEHIALLNARRGQKVLRITEAPEAQAPRPNWPWAVLVWLTASVVLAACAVKFGL